jgi:hypothetical protein
VQNAPSELLTKIRADSVPWLRERQAAVERAALKLKSREDAPA